MCLSETDQKRENRIFFFSLHSKDYTKPAEMEEAYALTIILLRVMLDKNTPAVKAMRKGC